MSQVPDIPDRLVTVSERISVNIEAATASGPDFLLVINVGEQSLAMTDWLQLALVVLSESDQLINLNGPYTRPADIVCRERTVNQESVLQAPQSVVQIGHYSIRLEDFLALTRKVLTATKITSPQDPRRRFLAKLPEIRDGVATDGERLEFLNWAMNFQESAGKRAKKPESDLAPQPA